FLNEFGQNMSGAANELMKDFEGIQEKMLENAKHAFLGVEKASTRARKQQIEDAKKVRDAQKEAQKEAQNQYEQMATDAKKSFEKIETAANALDAAVGLWEIGRAITDIDEKAQAAGSSAEAFVSKLMDGQSGEALDHMREQLVKLEEMGYESATKLMEMFDEQRKQRQEATRKEIEETRKELEKSLKALGVGVGEIENFVGEAERKAIDSFDSIFEKMKDAGLSAGDQARLLQDSYLAAFKKIESEAGREELKAKLASMSDAGIISAEEYKAVLSAVAQHQREVAIEAQKQAEETARKEREKAQAVRETTESLGKQKKAYTELTEAAIKSQKAYSGFGEALANYVRGASDEIAAISDAAAQAFDQEMASSSIRIDTIDGYFRRLSETHKRYMQQAEA